MFAWFKGVSNCLAQSVRYASSLAPRRFKYRKAHKGRLPVHTGGSQAGTCLVYGRFGLRLLEPTRLSATQIEAVTKAIKRKLRSNKQTKIWLRVFPDVAVCKKGNEVRMGKGKGAFDHWACRVGWNRILLELDAPGMRVEVAKEAVRLGMDKLAVRAEFVEQIPATLKSSLENDKFIN